MPSRLPSGYARLTDICSGAAVVILFNLIARSQTGLLALSPTCEWGLLAAFVLLLAILVACWRSRRRWPLLYCLLGYMLLHGILASPRFEIPFRSVERSSICALYESQPWPQAQGSYLYSLVYQACPGCDLWVEEDPPAYLDTGLMMVMSGARALRTLDAEQRLELLGSVASMDEPELYPTGYGPRFLVYTAPPGAGGGPGRTVGIVSRGDDVLVVPMAPPGAE